MGKPTPCLTDRWVDGIVAPHSYRHLEYFALEGTIPVWRFASAKALLKKRPAYPGSPFRLRFMTSDTIVKTISLDPCARCDDHSLRDYPEWFDCSYQFNVRKK